jgi:hypothetical protein
MTTMTLADAIIAEDISLIREYMHYGVNLNQMDEYGFTPLVEAVIANNVEIAKLLIEYRADVNLPDTTGNTPLHWAVENNNLDLCKLFLDHGANANAYTFAGQPVLVMPVLRQQTELKKLLMQYGAQLSFAQDFINAKLLGHMFELVGTADIVDSKNQFVEVDFEGFYLEFSLGIIAEAVAQFKNHFAARQLRRYSPVIQLILETILRSSELSKFQQYRVKVEKHQKEISALMQNEPVLLPVAYEGHAITFIKLGNILVKCDRREDSRLYDNVYFYHINRPKHATEAFFQDLIYGNHPSEYINEDLHKILDLQPITELKVAAQISGNCSWANVEASIPVIFFLMFTNKADFQKNMSQYKALALSFFEQWREWNKDRALSFCIQSFKQTDSIRKACKAEILAAILFQSCAEDTSKNRERIQEILPILMNLMYEHILQNYVQSYCYEDQSDEGKQFLRMLKENGYMGLR